MHRRVVFSRQPRLSHRRGHAVVERWPTLLRSCGTSSRTRRPLTVGVARGPDGAGQPAHPAAAAPGVDPQAYRRDRPHPGLDLARLRPARVRRRSSSRWQERHAGPVPDAPRVVRPGSGSHRTRPSRVSGLVVTPRGFSLTVDIDGVRETVHATAHRLTITMRRVACPCSAARAASRWAAASAASPDAAAEATGPGAAAGDGCDDRPMSDRFDLDHFLSLPRLSGLCLSPSGDRLAVSMSSLAPDGLLDAQRHLGGRPDRCERTHGD